MLDLSSDSHETSFVALEVLVHSPVVIMLTQFYIFGNTSKPYSWVKDKYND